MIRFFANHPTAANLLMVAIMLVGLVVTPSLKRETFPDFTVAEVEVKIIYRGASASEVEEAICQRLEDAVESVDNIKEVRCEAREGFAAMVAEMRGDADIDRFINDIKTEVEAIDDFPEEIETPTIRQLATTDHVVSVVLTGPMALPDLKAYAEDLKDRMLRAGIGTAIDIQGFSDHQIRIELSAMALRQLSVSVADIADAVEHQSLDLPSGTITTGERELLVRFADEGRSVQDYEDLIVVGSDSGAEIRLGEIARISDRFEDDEVKIVLNGERAAVLDVAKSKDQDTLDVMATLKAFLDEENARAPPSVRLALTRDVSSIVQDRLDMLLSNGAQGLILVLAVMTLFFSLRFSFWVAMGLPVSFLGTLAAMAVLGLSINMITMVALLIAIGLLMDDAIVIAENIATKLEQGTAPMQAAFEGTREVAPAVVSSFLTTICVFAPLTLLEGRIGMVLRVLPIVLIVTLAVSLIEAFLILPHHLARAGARAQQTSPNRFRRSFDHGFDYLRMNIFGPLVDGAVRWRYLTIGAAVGLLLASLAVPAGGLIRFQPFPDIDGNVVEARLLLPQGTPLARTETMVARIEAALASVDAELTPEQPEGRKLVRQINSRYGVNQDAFESGSHLATVTADLLSAEERSSTIDEILSAWREATGAPADVISLTFKEPFLGPAGRAIEIRLVGNDLHQMKDASQAIQGILSGYRGVVDLSDDLRPGKPELRLALRPGATALGLDATAIARQLRAAFFGTTVSDIQIGSEAYEIDVRFDERDRDSVDDLETFTVTAADGSQVPLGAVTRLTEGRGWARIQRIDGQRVVTVIGDVDTRLGNADAIVADSVASFRPLLARDFPGVGLALEGQAAESGETAGSVQRGFILGLAGIFILLSIQFRSYVEPFIVMAAIPLAFIGVIWGHLLLGLDLSMPGVVGFVSLAGIVVNDSILLVTFIKRNRATGTSTIEAACQASRQRFRAVLLTSVTTIVGLLPLLTESSLQAQILKPLVVSLAFGLLASTFLVLIVVPALYTVVDELSGKRIAARQAQAASP